MVNEGISINQRNVLDDISSRKEKRLNNRPKFSNTSNVILRFLERMTPQRPKLSDFKEEYGEFYNEETKTYHTFRLPNLAANKARRYVITADAIRAKGTSSVRHITGNYSRPQTMDTRARCFDIVSVVNDAKPRPVTTNTKGKRIPIDTRLDAGPKIQKKQISRTIVSNQKQKRATQSPKTNAIVTTFVPKRTSIPDLKDLSLFKPFQNDKKEKAVDIVFPFYKKEKMQCDSILLNSAKKGLEIDRNILKAALISPFDLKKPNIHTLLKTQEEVTITEVVADSNDIDSAVKIFHDRSTGILSRATLVTSFAGNRRDREVPEQEKKSRIKSRWTAREYKNIKDHIALYRKKIDEEKLKNLGTKRYISQATAHPKIDDIASNITKITIAKKSEKFDEKLLFSPSRASRPHSAISAHFAPADIFNRHSKQKSLVSEYSAKDLAIYEPVLS